MATNSRFFDPFYFLNVALMGTYLAVRKFFDFSSLEQTDMMSFGLNREQQIFACAGIFYLVKLPHMTTNDARVGNLFLYFKFVVIVISIVVDIRMFVGYLTIFLLFAIFVKQPEYRGEHNCVAFKDTESFMAATNKANVNWCVYCYTSWADNCIQFSPIFAELSLKYGNKHLKFGKIDIGKHPGIANKYSISIKPNTKQLPTLLLLSNGKEVERMPTWKDPKYPKQGVKKVPLSMKNIEATLNLAQMNQKPKTEKKDKKSKNKKNSLSSANSSKLNNISK